MTTTTDQRWRRLPTDAGVADQSQKGQPHHAHHVREVARNINYTIQHRIPAVCIGGNGHKLDYGEGVLPEVWRTAAGGIWSQNTGPVDENITARGHIVVWNPHSHNLTIGYAFRAMTPGILAVTDVILYVSDVAWSDHTFPSNANIKSETIALNMAGTYFNGGLGTANGEYTGEFSITFPPSADGMYHVYINFDHGVFGLTVLGSWCLWVVGGTP